MDEEFILQIEKLTGITTELNFFIKELSHDKLSILVSEIKEGTAPPKSVLLVYLWLLQLGDVAEKLTPLYKIINQNEMLNKSEFNKLMEGDIPDEKQ